MSGTRPVINNSKSVSKPIGKHRSGELQYMPFPGRPLVPIELFERKDDSAFMKNIKRSLIALYTHNPNEMNNDNEIMGLTQTDSNILKGKTKLRKIWIDRDNNVRVLNSQKREITGELSKSFLVLLEQLAIHAKYPDNKDEDDDEILAKIIHGASTYGNISGKDNPFENLESIVSTEEFRTLYKDSEDEEEDEEYRRWMAMDADQIEAMLFPTEEILPSTPEPGKKDNDDFSDLGL